MKTQAIAILILLAFMGVALAVTLTIDIPANDIPRVQEAFGSILGLGRPANQAEVTAATKQWIIGQTQDYEKRKNMAVFSPSPLEMIPSPTPTAGGLKASTPAPTSKPKK